MEQTNLPDENIKIAGYGESRPVASNSTEEGRAKNRRVSIKIYNQLNSDTETSIE
jgi:chemotaxis protein MotB